MLKMFYMVLIISATLCFSASAGQHLKSNLSDKPSEKIIFTDATGDGKPDILERWYNGKRCRWFDGNGDMTENDKLGDIANDTLQIDINGDGYYDGSDDMTVKWVDNTGNGTADLQIIVINPRQEDGKTTKGNAHYMVFEDLDGDGAMAYINWQRFDLACWHNTGRCNFLPDYHGNSLFLKAHRSPSMLGDAKLNWENPFAFYDTDDDGCTEMAIRFLDNYPCNGSLDAAYITYDIDNDSQTDNELDYDFTLWFAGDNKYDYTGHVNKFPAMKAADWQLEYFQNTQWLVIDELIYVAHEECYELAFDIGWDRCYFVFDEDDDNHRWERVEMYYPFEPYNLREVNSYDLLMGGKDAPMNAHPQSDSLGDRAEFDADNSGKGKLYFANWDRRLHLFGAEWGAWLLDSGAKFEGSILSPNITSKELATELEEVVLYYDTDVNGFIDLLKFDYDGDGAIDLTINLLDYGTDEFELIDPANVGWEGLNEAFRANAAVSWDEAYEFYRAFWRTGLSEKSIDDLAFASSTWDKYYTGYKLKEAIFRRLDEKLKSTPQVRKTLHKYYFTGDFESLAKWMSTLDMESF